MTEPHTVKDDICGLVSLFAAGALPAGEEAAFRSHLKTCSACAHEVGAFQDAVNWLPFASQLPSPPAALREKLLARILEPEPPPGIQIVRGGEGAWRPLVPGVVARRLYEDPHDGNVALLVRMEAGAKYPPHSHAGVEHCYVLEGDLRFGDLVLNPGDYQCALASTNHRDSHTVNGCMVLIIASRHNALLPWSL